MARLMVLLLLASALSAAYGHGYITIPPAKQLVNNLYGVTLQHGNSIGNGGGRPISNPGICGDPFQQSDSSVINTPFKTNTPYIYSTNGLITINLTLTANHGGRHQFRVCPATTPTAACLGTNWLTATGNPSAADMPVEGKRYWYISFKADRFGAYPYETYGSQWRLPAGVSCADGCVLQWSWAAYQNCAFPCEDSAWDDATKCGLDQRGNRQICDGSSLLFAEIFQNCADIKITSGTTPVSSPPPSVNPVANPSPPPRSSPSSPPPPTTTRSPSPPPPSNGACPIPATTFCSSSGPGLFPNPCSCSSFFNCASGGNGALMSCPTGLYFNKLISTCDWPQNVKC